MHGVSPRSGALRPRGGALIHRAVIQGTRWTMGKFMLMVVALVTATVLSACGPTCNNTCTTSGTTQCSGAQVQTCTADASSCLTWSPAEACDTGKVCQNNACVDVCSQDAVKAACAGASAHY